MAKFLPLSKHLSRFLDNWHWKDCCPAAGVLRAGLKNSRLSYSPVSTVWSWVLCFLPRISVFCSFPEALQQKPMCEVRESWEGTLYMMIWTFWGHAGSFCKMPVKFVTVTVLFWVLLIIQILPHILSYILIGGHISHFPYCKRVSPYAVNMYCITEH